MPRRKRANLPVACPNCGHIHLETTGQYTPNQPAHPGMVRLVEPYAGYGWTAPPPDITAGFGCLECCNCGAAMAPNGKLKVITDDGT